MWFMEMHQLQMQHYMMQTCIEASVYLFSVILLYMKFIVILYMYDFLILIFYFVSLWPKLLYVKNISFDVIKSLLIITVCLLNFYYF